MHDLAQTIFDVVHYPLVIVDGTLHVRYANPAYLKLFQVDPSQLGEEPLDRLGAGHWDARHLRAWFVGHLTGEFRETCQVEYVNERQEPRMMRLTARHCDSPDGEDWGPATVIAIEDVTDNTRQVRNLKRAEAALALRNRALEAVSQGILILDCRPTDACRFGAVIYVSPGFERMTGFTGAEVLGGGILFLCGKDNGKDADPEGLERLKNALRDGAAGRLQLQVSRRNGSKFWAEVSLSSWRDPTDTLKPCVVVLTDITEKRRLEEQYLQAQKMEAVGRLAGGVAHDFNNLLTIILGYSDLLLQSLPADDPSRELVEEIHRAGERSGALTRQLLVFSRKQFVTPRVVDVTVVVKNAEKMLARIIGEDIRLETVLAEPLGHIRIDIGHLEQVLLNLAVNARDAMPQGGRLLLETKNVWFDQHAAQLHGDVPPGHYVLLAVSDNGSGMTAEVRARAFEPFFTTKGAGHGTGLGLSVVHGIVTQAEGFIDIYSEPKVGTMIKLYFPRVDTPPRGNGSAFDAVVAPRGTETVLLVEDEDGVRALTNHILKKLGYEVFSAANGSEAMRIARECPKTIHLLVTDVVMPDMGGRQLAGELVRHHPETKVLYLSGYTDDAVVRHGILHEDMHFLQKPFSSTGLAIKVREVIDG